MTSPTCLLSCFDEPHGNLQVGGGREIGSSRADETRVRAQNRFVGGAGKTTRERRETQMNASDAEVDESNASEGARKHTGMVSRTERGSFHSMSLQ